MKHACFFVKPISLLAACWMVAVIDGSGSPARGPMARQETTAGASPLPSPDISGLEEAVQEHIGEIQSIVEELLQNPELSAAGRGEAIGMLGQLYHAYDLIDAAEACYRSSHELQPSEFRWLYYLGHLSQSAGRLEPARAYYEQALLLSNKDLQTLVHLGEVHLQSNQPEKAQEYFEAAFAVDDSSAATRAGLGQVALLQQDYLGAIEHIEAALALVADANRLHYPLAMAYRGIGKLDEASEHLAKAGQVGVKVADPLIDELERLTRGERVHTLRGRMAFNASRYAEAVQEFFKAVQAAPESAGARVNLGSALGQLGQQDDAIIQYREALRLQPGNPNALYNLGHLLARKRIYKEAVRYLSILVEDRADDREARLELGRALEQMGAFREAGEHYKRIIDVEPSHEAAYLGMARMLTREGEYNQALRLLEEAHQRTPERGLTAHALARFLAGCPDRNLRDGERALDLAQRIFTASNTPASAETVAMALAELERCSEASEWQKRTLAAIEGKIAPERIRELRAVLALYEGGPPCNGADMPEGVPQQH